MGNSRDGKGVDLYLNQEARRGIKVWNEQRAAQGEPELEERAFVQTAIFDKLRREVDASIRLDIARSTSRGKRYRIFENTELLDEQREREENGG